MAEVVSGDSEPSSPVKNPLPANRRAARGRSALVLANINDDDDSSDSENSGPISKTKKPLCGIYLQKLNKTKQDIKENHHILDNVVESKLNNLF